MCTDPCSVMYVELGKFVCVPFSEIELLKDSPDTMDCF